jgi:hypothetical protein
VSRDEVTQGLLGASKGEGFSVWSMKKTIPAAKQKKPAGAGGIFDL